MKPCYIYKAFRGEEVLYVGITDKVNRRFGQHKTYSDWFPLQDKILVCKLPNRSICKLYETYLIKTLQPKFNKAENNGDDFSLMSFDEQGMVCLEYEESVHEKPAVDTKYQRRDEDYSTNNENFLSLMEDNKEYLSRVEYSEYDNIVLTFTFTETIYAEEFQLGTGLTFKTENYNLCTSCGWKDKEVNFNIIDKCFDKEDTVELELLQRLKTILNLIGE